MSNLVVWQVTDEKPGHESQTLGLAEALARLTRTSTRRITNEDTGGLLGLVLRRSRDSLAFEKPDLIVCCGRRTHLVALALRFRFGGKVIVLMRPSLPSCFFDLMVVPIHDSTTPNPKVLSTQGTVNSMRPDGQHYTDRGLILVGGPSRHYAWSSEHVFRQIEQVVESSNTVLWTIGTSRRTPPDMELRLASLPQARATVVLARETYPGWVANRMAEVGQAWITEDSVSMVYEALSADVSVGLLEVPRLGSSRIARGIASLIEGGRVGRFCDWQQGEALPRLKPLAEADRIATEVLRRWYPERVAETHAA